MWLKRLSSLKNRKFEIFPIFSISFIEPWDEKYVQNFGFGPNRKSNAN